jgi:hypothetical protein
MGHYFYARPLLTYSNSAVQENTPANVTSGLASNTFSGTVVFTNSSVTSNSLSSTYANSIPLSVTARNQNGTTTSSQTTIQAIVDGPSYTLISTTLSGSLVSPSTKQYGFRVSSGTVSATYPTMNVPDITATPVANTAYDNTANITSLQELQVSNGRFTTPSAQTYSYLNYNGYKYTNSSSNTFNYSGISSTGYRYTTFAWRLPTPAQYTSLAFTMNGISSNGTPITLTITDSVAYIGGTRVLVYYRFENAATPVPTDGNNFSSAWLDGNIVTSNPTSTGNYWITSTPTTTYYALIPPATSSSGSATFPVFCLPTNLLTGQTINLYCRVGLPMDNAISFSTVSVAIS